MNIFQLSLIFSLIKASTESNYSTIEEEDYESGLITITENKGDIFYWLFKPRSGERGNAPLVLWMNGGPGGSSLVGLFYENGPFILGGQMPNIYIQKREISWNKEQYILYVEQQRGVGFSRCLGEPCYDEECVADDFYVFILKFYALHPIFIYRPLYIMGQSYAGKIIPAIVRKLYIEGNTRINLVGVGIGNPWIHPISQSAFHAKYLLYTGITKLEQYLQDKSIELVCQLLIKLGANSASAICQVSRLAPSVLYNFNVHDIRLPRGYDFSALSHILNDTAIKQKLGVADREFVLSSQRVGRDFELNMLKSQKFNMEYMLKKGLKILIYSGMEDYLCNYMGTEEVIKELDWPFITEWERTAEREYTVDGVLVGYYKEYKNLKYLKIKCAGHYVPMDQPLIAYHMLMNFIDNTNQ